MSWIKNYFFCFLSIYDKMMAGPHTKQCNLFHSRLYGIGEV